MLLTYVILYSRCVKITEENCKISNTSGLSGGSGHKYSKSSNSADPNSAVSL